MARTILATTICGLLLAGCREQPPHPLERATPGQAPCQVRLVGAQRVDGGDQQLVRIELEVTNDSPTRKIDFRGWTDFGGDALIRVSDELGNEYSAFDNMSLMPLPEGASQPTSLYPGKSGRYFVFCQPPVEASKTLVFELPASPVGERLRFSLPVAEITPD